jgi:hypothetical protein
VLSGRDGNPPLTEASPDQQCAEVGSPSRAGKHGLAGHHRRPPSIVDNGARIRRIARSSPLGYAPTLFRLCLRDLLKAGLALYKVHMQFYQLLKLT